VSKLIVHNVYFQLHDATQKAKLIEACQAYLAHHDGILWFGVGELAAELKRDVNELNWDVGLHIIFRDQAAHDAYQVAGDHIRFIAENKANWKKVRVFDTSAEARPTKGGKP
jgi:hypothetical protein